MSAQRPFGGRLTLDQAATISGKSLRTIQRWVEHKHIRIDLTADGFVVSELDVIAMEGKRWTRTPRLRHTA